MEVGKMRNFFGWALLTAILACGQGCGAKNSPVAPSNNPSPTGATFFFESTRAATSNNIFSAVLGSSSVVTLTSSMGTTEGDTEPDYSPAARRVVFMSYGPSSQFLVTCNANGSQPTTLTSTAVYAPRDPVWSPDGTQIAFGTPSGIVKVTASGTGPVTLIPSSGNNDPSWSPDGTRIAFSGGAHICTMSAVDGSAVTDLSALSLGVTTPIDFSPAWSPDGTKIAFCSNRNANSTGTQTFSQVFLMAANGSGVTEVTLYSTTPGQSRDAYELRWSPDGVRILYTSDLNGSSNAGIFQVNPDGTGQAALAVNDPSVNEIVGDY